jgi:hypothetical protein
LVAFMRACLRVAASAKAGGQKTFLLNLHRLNTCLSADRDTQAAGQANGMGRGVHSPDARVRQLAEAIYPPEPHFSGGRAHNVKLYNCAAGERWIPVD